MKKIFALLIVLPLLLSSCSQTKRVVLEGGISTGIPKPLSQITEADMITLGQPYLPSYATLFLRKDSILFAFGTSPSSKNFSRFPACAERSFYFGEGGNPVHYCKAIEVLGNLFGVFSQDNHRGQSILFYSNYLLYERCFGGLIFFPKGQHDKAYDLLMKLLETVKFDGAVPRKPSINDE